MTRWTVERQVWILTEDSPKIEKARSRTPFNTGREAWTHNPVEKTQPERPVRTPELFRLSLGSASYTPVQVLPLSG